MQLLCKQKSSEIESEKSFASIELVHGNGLLIELNEFQLGNCSCCSFTLVIIIDFCVYVHYSQPDSSPFTKQTLRHFHHSQFGDGSIQLNEHDDVIK